MTSFACTRHSCLLQAVAVDDGRSRCRAAVAGSTRRRSVKGSGYAKTGALSWTPELAEGCDGCGFVFPDDEALVEAEFQRNLPFALDVAKSASDSDDPVSHLGLETKPST